METPDWIRSSEELAPWTWWKVGGPAEYFCLPKDISEVSRALAWARDFLQPVTVLGGGSNVLVSDQGVSGLVICLRELKGLTSEEATGRIKITALAGTPKSELLKVFLKHKLPPALFVCGLPGDVGGGVVMNAGVSEKIVPREFCELVDWVDVLKFHEGDFRLCRFQKNEIEWTYRHSEGWQPGVIVEVGLSWENKPDPTIMNKVKEATKSRLQRQPLNLPSCGSVFKNPDPLKAGALIEECGLKGYSVGGAQVSEKHANFIVNNGGAKASEIHQIISHIKKTVKEKKSVELETEVRYLGRFKGNPNR